MLTVLDARGVPVSGELRARILASSDLAELEHWLQRAVSVSTADELFGR